MKLIKTSGNDRVDDALRQSLVSHSNLDSANIRPWDPNRGISQKHSLIPSST